MVAAITDRIHSARKSLQWNRVTGFSAKWLIIIIGHSQARTALRVAEFLLRRF
jgi:hypothetical protein